MLSGEIVRFMWRRILRVICLAVFFIPVGCRYIPNTDKYFTFPVTEIGLSEIKDTLLPRPICDSAWTYQAWYIDGDQGVFLSPLSLAQSKFVTVSDISSGTEYGRFCEIGRGPQDFLSPLASDYTNGYLSIFDLMTTRYSELDIESSVSQGRSIFVRNLPLDKSGKDYLSLFSIHRWKDSLLAYDMGQNPASDDLYRMPDYVMYDVESGKKQKNLHLIQNSPLTNLKRERDLVPVKGRLAATDFLDEASNRLCFAMCFIPQLNIVNLETGESRGFIVKDLKKTSLQNGFRHYHDIAAFRDRIYALYFGLEENKIFSGKAQTELHVFDWGGKMHARYIILDVVNGCQASDRGLYVTLFSNNSYRLNLIPWDQLLD